MNGATLDIDIYDNRVFEFKFFWYDKVDALIDVTGYGAIFVVKESADGKELIKSTHQDDLTIGGTSGFFSGVIPPSKTGNLNFKTGLWELVVFPTAASPTVNPIPFLNGDVLYHKTLATLEL